MSRAYVFIPKDIPHRTTGSSTWVEAGAYPVIKKLDRGRYLIVLNTTPDQRLLTVVRPGEVQ